VGVDQTSLVNVIETQVPITWQNLLSGKAFISILSTMAGAIYNPQGPVEVDGNFSVTGTVAVSGPVTMTGPVTIVGPITASGSVGVTGTFSVTGTVAVTGPLIVEGAIQGGTSIGYGPAGEGTGTIITQTTGKTTAVTINTIVGQIITNSSTIGATSSVSFLVSNTTVTGSDVVVLNLRSGAANSAAYEYSVNQVNAGSFLIYIANVTGGGLAEALVFNYAVIKGVNT
jgi:hypothetical protein